MSEEITVAAYIQHHMNNLSMPLFGGQYGTFWTLHLDTFFFSTLLGTIFCLTFYLAARKATPGVPSRWQNFVEMMVEFVQQQVKESVHHVDGFIGPLALTIFVWVFLMNFMDLLPVDLLPLAGHAMGLKALRVVPTTDLTLTFALSISVFLILFVYKFRYKGLWGFVKDMTCHPFPPFLFPVNLVLRLVEECA